MSVAPPPPARSAGGIGFTLFGFPTRVQYSFFVVAVILGLFPGATVATVLIWVAVVGISVMWHELGHAFAARRLGANPTIELYSFGGLTRWMPRADASRWDMISVAAAGPGAGLALGLVVAAVVSLTGEIEGHDLRFLTISLLWVNIGWSLVNLLPVLPLDGGHIVSEALPGTREQRQRRASILSVGFGTVAAVALIAIGYYWGALVFGWAIATNITTLRAPAIQRKARAVNVDVQTALAKIAARHPDGVDAAVETGRLLGPSGVAFKLVAIETAAAAGDARAAEALLDRMPGQVPPALYALVTVVGTAGLEGLEELDEIFERVPDPYHGRWLGLALHRAGRIDELLPRVHAIASPRRSADMVSAVADVADWAGRGDVAAGLRSLPVG